jgi:hypothetical protein
VNVAGNPQWVQTVRRRIATDAVAVAAVDASDDTKRWRDTTSNAVVTVAVVGCVPASPRRHGESRVRVSSRRGASRVPQTHARRRWPCYRHTHRHTVTVNRNTWSRHGHAVVTWLLRLPWRPAAGAVRGSTLRLRVGGARAVAPPNDVSHRGEVEARRVHCTQRATRCSRSSSNGSRPPNDWNQSALNGRGAKLTVCTAAAPR